MAETLDEQIARIDKLMEMLESDLIEVERYYISRSNNLSSRLDDLRNQRNELQRTEA